MWTRQRSSVASRCRRGQYMARGLKAGGQTDVGPASSPRHAVYSQTEVP